MDAEERRDLFLSGLARLTEEYGYTFFVEPMLTETDAVPGTYHVDSRDVVEWMPFERSDDEEVANDGEAVGKFDLIFGEEIDDDYEVIDDGDTGELPSTLINRQG